MNRVDIRVALATLVVLGAAVGARPVKAQSDPLVEARRLADEGLYAEAAVSVRAWLATHPDDPGVRWLLARWLHWSGDAASARPEFEAAVEALPGDPWLRLEQVRALMDLRRFDAADAVLDVVLGMQQADEEVLRRARALRGTVAYWRGDLPLAIERYEEALALDDGNAEARARLDEIRAALRAWIRVGATLWRDNQPYRRYAASLELGAWIHPLWSLSAEVVPARLVPDAGATAASGRVGLVGYVPAARLELGARLGLSGGSVTRGTRTTWTGEGSLGVRLGTRTRLGARAWRERYVWTVTSADTLLSVTGVEAAFDAADAPGWAGEVVVRREGFPDDNALRTLYGWVLAPLAPWLRTGYALSWQDSDASRWSPTWSGGGPGQGPGGPPGTGFATDGTYAPYFTPEATYVQSLLGELLVPVGAGSLRTSLSWGIDAVEDAPYLVAVGPPGLETPEVRFAERSFRPWTVRAALTLPAGASGDVRLDVERGRTAFYRATRASFVWTRRLGGGEGGGR